MKIKKAMLALTTVAVLSMAITSVSLFARERGITGPNAEHRNSESRQQKRLGRLTSLLELTEEQQASIETLNETFGEQISTLRESMHENREILKTLAEATPVDSNAIQQVADAQGALFSDLVMLKTEKRIAFAAILTQEQLDKLEELHAAIADRRGDKNDAEELDG
jgi:Spy/CpxP family protein refolding chaperone